MYAQKLQSYANTLYWNETLRADSYKNKLDFTALLRSMVWRFKPMPSFGPDELEARQLLFEMSNIIWKS